MTQLPLISCKTECMQCGEIEADRYVWCRPCIKRAARGAARYFVADRTVQMTHGDPYAQADYLRRQTNRWEKRFKRRLKRRRS